VIVKRMKCSFASMNNQLKLICIHYKLKRCLIIQQKDTNMIEWFKSVYRFYNEYEVYMKTDLIMYITFIIATILFFICVV